MVQQKAHFPTLRKMFDEQMFLLNDTTITDDRFNPPTQTMKTLMTLNLVDEDYHSDEDLEI